MQVELKGVVKVIFAEQKINDKLDRKDIVITVDTVVVKCNLRGKGTNGKFYNQLDVWDVIKL